MVSMNPRQSNQKTERTSSMLGQRDASGVAATGSANDWAIGCTIHLVTTLDEEIYGTIFAFDKLTNCLTLMQESEDKRTTNYTILKTTFIKQILSAELPETTPDMHLPYVDLRGAVKEELDKIIEKKIAETGGLPTAPIPRNSSSNLNSLRDT